MRNYSHFLAILCENIKMVYCNFYWSLIPRDKIKKKKD